MATRRFCERPLCIYMPRRSRPYPRPKVTPPPSRSLPPYDPHLQLPSSPTTTLSSRNAPPFTMLSHFYFLACFLGLSFLSTFGQAAPLDKQSLRAVHSTTLDPGCQAVKSSGGDPLQYCPKNSVFVSQKHPAAKYRSINSALNDL